jgi:hypothetical protein
MEATDGEEHMYRRTYALTQQQKRRLQTFDEAHVVVSTRRGVAIVRRPDGRLLRIQPDGHLSGMLRVERVQSYLHVFG